MLILTTVNGTSVNGTSESTTSVGAPSFSGQSATATSTIMATNTATHTGDGITESNKINLGVGIGIGIPSFIVALIGTLLAFRAMKKKKSARKPEVARGADNEMTSMSTNDPEREVNQGESPFTNTCGLLLMWVHWCRRLSTGGSPHRGIRV